MKETTDYSRFTFASSNRPLSKRHIEGLTLSISKFGYLSDKPIKVVSGENNQFVIIDGQHRFQACKQIGESVRYEELDPKEATDYLIATNSAQLSWKPEDFLRVYSSLGNQHYLRFSMFCAALDCSVATGLFIGKMAGLASMKGDPALIRTRWKSGDFTFSTEDWDKMTDFRFKLDDVRLQPLYKDFAKQPAFVRALSQLILTPGYDHERFLKQLSKAPTKIIRTNSAEDYIVMLLEVYNLYYRAESRLDREDVGPVAHL